MWETIKLYLGVGPAERYGDPDSVSRVWFVIPTLVGLLVGVVVLTLVNIASGDSVVGAIAMAIAVMAFASLVSLALRWWRTSRSRRRS